MADESIVADYLGGLDVPGLARRHHRTNRTISRILREAGVLGTLQRRRDERRRGRPSPAHLASAGLRRRPTGTEWAYIAGLFDAEGSIVARGDRALADGHARYLVTLVQKDPAPLEWIQAVAGAGAIYFANRTYRYHLVGQRAVFEFLGGVERHLVVKRAKAAAALARLAASYGWRRRGGREGGDEVAR